MSCDGPMLPRLVYRCATNAKPHTCRRPPIGCICFEGMTNDEERAGLGLAIADFGHTPACYAARGVAADEVRAEKRLGLFGTLKCSCRPVNRAPFAGICGSCGGVVEPCCGCTADKRTRAPGHVVIDPKSNGACTALVSDFGEVCDYCRSRCGDLEGRLG